MFYHFFKVAFIQLYMPVTSTMTSTRAVVHFYHGANPHRQVEPVLFGTEPCAKHTAEIYYKRGTKGHYFTTFILHI